MKKVTLMLAALALVLGISQCKKQEQPVQAGEKQHIELTADNGNDGSKVGGEFSAATMNLYWEEDDVITVSGGAIGRLTLDRGAGTSQGHFSGEVTLASRADLVFTWTKLDGEPDFNDQAGTEDWITDNLVLEATDTYKDNGKYSLKMEMPYAVLKLNVSALGTTGAMTIAANGATVASVTDVASSEGKAVFVAVPTDGAEKTYTITCNGKTATKTWTLEKNVFYTKAGAEGAGTGDAIVIKHEFSVGSGKTVEFAPGNLYYNGSSWQFEANQWDFRTYEGKNSCIGGSVTEDGTPAGHWGLFGWSGSTGSATYGMSTSTNNSDYSGDFVDWGTASGLPSAGEGKTWRTLSMDEWMCLLNIFNASSGARTDANRFAKAVVNGVKGLLIFPDGYNGGTAISGITGIAEVNKIDASYPSDNIPPETWTLMESAGVVFLPTAGYRDGAGIGSVGSVGAYWTSTPFEWNCAYNLLCKPDNVSPRYYNVRRFGRSVRLVSAN